MKYDTLRTEAYNDSVSVTQVPHSSKDTPGLPYEPVHPTQ